MCDLIQSQLAIYFAGCQNESTVSLLWDTFLRTLSMYYMYIYTFIYIVFFLGYQSWWNWGFIQTNTYCNFFKLNRNFVPKFRKLWGDLRGSLPLPLPLEVFKYDNSSQRKPLTHQNALQTSHCIANGKGRYIKACWDNNTASKDPPNIFWCDNLV